MSSAAALAGWVAAGIAAATMIAVRRILGSRMEAVARACHELRGPITAARLGLSFGERSGELSAARLRAIDAELDRATLALDDLAGVGGRVPRCPDDLEEVDPACLLSQSVEAWQGYAQAARMLLQMRWDGETAPVWGHRLRLAQATGNLIANAIEHGAGRVQVVGSIRGGVARIEITDEGPGLPAPIEDLIRPPRRGPGARGRGLAITAAIAEDHGGHLTTAAPHRGACLVLELAAINDGRRENAGRPSSSAISDPGAWSAGALGRSPGFLRRRRRVEAGPDR
jgi:signal transduction histidine kinase